MGELEAKVKELEDKKNKLTDKVLFHIYPY
jgi:hypothetical protein